MNEINLHDVQRIAITERRDFETFSAITIRIATLHGDLDVVCYSNEYENLAITKLNEDEF